jgi:hypothetical protein
MVVAEQDVGERRLPRDFSHELDVAPWSHETGLRTDDFIGQEGKEHATELGGDANRDHRLQPEDVARLGEDNDRFIETDGP